MRENTAGLQSPTRLVTGMAGGVVQRLLVLYSSALDVKSFYVFLTARLSLILGSRKEAISWYS